MAVLKDVAAILKIPMEAIQNFDEERVVSIISNTFTSSDSSTLNAVNPYCTFNNPVDKLFEAFEEVKRLNAEIIKLKDEQIKLLQSLLDQK